MEIRFRVFVIMIRLIIAIFTSWINFVAKKVFRSIVSNGFCTDIARSF